MGWADDIRKQAQQEADEKARAADTQRDNADRAKERARKVLDSIAPEISSACKEFGLPTAGRLLRGWGFKLYGERDWTGVRGEPPGLIVFFTTSGGWRLARTPNTHAEGICYKKSHENGRCVKLCAVTDPRGWPIIPTFTVDSVREEIKQALGHFARNNGTRYNID